MATHSEARETPRGAFGAGPHPAEEVSGEHPAGTAAAPQSSQDAPTAPEDAREPLRSGAFPTDATRAEDRPFASLAPYYAPQGEVEHATLDIPDLVVGEPTLLTGSSLVPPERGSFPWAKVSAGVVALAALAVAGATLVPALTPERATEPVAVVVPVAPVAPVAPVVQPQPTATDPVAVEAAAPAAQAQALAVPGEVAPAAIVETPAAEAPRGSKPEPARPPVAAREAGASSSDAPTERSAESVREAHGVEAPAVEEPEATPQREVAAPAESTSAAALTLPTIPTREQIAQGFDAVRSKLVECAGGTKGVVDATVTIAGTGRVRYAKVGGDFAGSPAGSCMARELRSARFPEFARASIQVDFPFSL